MKRDSWLATLTSMSNSSGVIADLWNIVLDYCFAERKWSVKKMLLKNVSMAADRASFVYHTALPVRRIMLMATSATPLELWGTTKIEISGLDGEFAAIKCPLSIGLRSKKVDLFKRMIAISPGHLRVVAVEYNGLNSSERSVDWDCRFPTTKDKVSDSCKSVSIEFSRPNSRAIVAKLSIENRPIHRQQINVPTTPIYPFVTLSSSSTHHNRVFTIDN